MVESDECQQLHDGQGCTNPDLVVQRVFRASLGRRLGGCIPARQADRLRVAPPRSHLAQRATHPRCQHANGSPPIPPRRLADCDSRAEWDALRATSRLSIEAASRRRGQGSDTQPNPWFGFFSRGGYARVATSLCNTHEESRTQTAHVCMLGRHVGLVPAGTLKPPNGSVYRSVQ